jgi:hypothetical protein
LSQILAQSRTSVSGATARHEFIVETAEHEIVRGHGLTFMSASRSPTAPRWRSAAPGRTPVASQTHVDRHVRKPAGTGGATSQIETARSSRALQPSRTSARNSGTIVVKNRRQLLAAIPRTSVASLGAGSAKAVGLHPNWPMGVASRLGHGRGSQLAAPGQLFRAGHPFTCRVDRSDGGVYEHDRG